MKYNILITYSDDSMNPVEIHFKSVAFTKVCGILTIEDPKIVINTSQDCIHRFRAICSFDEKRILALEVFAVKDDKKDE